MSELISCEQLTMRYDNETALEEVSFTVEEGDYLCILGENGSGKSTLIKGLLGLKPIQSGRIHFSGIERTQIGYLPQQTQVQRDFPASVYEVVLSGCISRKGRGPFFRREEKQRAVEKMRQMGIEALRKKSYRELSGGQQQRVLLARALCATEKLLLLDEPVTGLDPLVTAELYALIDRLNREQGVTILMVSHDVKGVLQSANKILQLHTGTIFYGSTGEYRMSEAGHRMIGGDIDA